MKNWICVAPSTIPMLLNSNKVHVRGPQQGNMTYEISKSREISQDFGIRFRKILPNEISRFQDFT